LPLRPRAAIVVVQASWASRDQGKRSEAARREREEAGMHAAAQPVRVYADGEAFAGISRLLFGPIRQVFLGDQPRAMPRLESIDLSACRLTHIRAPAHAVVSDKTLRRSFDPDAVKILLQLAGRTRFEQEAIVVALGPRSAVVYDPVRAYALQNVSAVDQIILQVPRATCGDETLARLRRPLAPPSEEDGLVRIVFNLMRTVSNEADKLDDFGCRRVGDSLIQLVRGLVTRGAADLPDRMTPLTTLKQRILDYVDSHIGKSGLSLEDIARNMGCSRRYLHRAFENEDSTLERFVWERRLRASRKALLSQDNGGQSISEIAFACGFNSSAHFSRAFKSRFGVAPRELREQARAARV